MIGTAAAVCLGMDVLTYTVCTVVKNKADVIKRVASPITNRVHDTAVVHGVAAKHAFKMYRDIVRSIRSTDAVS